MVAVLGGSTEDDGPADIAISVGGFTDVPV